MDECKPLFAGSLTSDQFPTFDALDNYDLQALAAWLRADYIHTHGTIHHI
jgi:hypothetical protein